MGHGKRDCIALIGLVIVGLKRVFVLIYLLPFEVRGDGKHVGRYRLNRLPLASVLTTVDAGQQILPHRDLRIHKMDRVPPSSQRYSRNNSLSVIEPYLLKIRTAFKGQL